VKKYTAARVAATLREEDEVDAELVSGSLGELTVLLQGSSVVTTSPMWYPTPSAVLKKVRRAIGKDVPI
jgi:hypothetical protein